ncbi:glutamic acid-rich protein-like [Dreissena polymorpha]|uniref:WKF domain-containing protein n=1 Tax=Dreissena polymorpha TaxID=45954 RepID=A0A9D4MNU6_DREPO|nr:glutamic acid-rich protein-like [Dreissena polymorpha]KAH3879304.1 hypothetical protein DPMN_003206 [Dreissena polymorpha]
MGQKKKHKITNDVDPGESQVKKKQELGDIETCPKTENLDAAESKKKKRKRSLVSDESPIGEKSCATKHFNDATVDERVMKIVTEMKNATSPALNKEARLIPEQLENNHNAKKRKKDKAKQVNSDLEKQGSIKHEHSIISKESKQKEKDALIRNIDKEDLETRSKVHKSTQNMLLAKLKSAQSKRKEQSDNYQHSYTEKSGESYEKSQDTSREDQTGKDIVMENEAEADDNVEKIDPEKLAIKEKKLAKRKQKKLDKERQKKEQEEKSGTAKASAIDYLDKWKHNRDEWKFNKVRQCWLLQNMYKEPLVDDDHFNILLEYLDGLQGKAREITRKEAEGYLHLDSDEDDDEKATDTQKRSEQKVDAAQYNRARQIVQLLAD